MDSPNDLHPGARAALGSIEINLRQSFNTLLLETFSKFTKHSPLAPSKYGWVEVVLWKFQAKRIGNTRRRSGQINAPPGAVLFRAPRRSSFRYRVSAPHRPFCQPLRHP